MSVCLFALVGFFVFFLAAGTFHPERCAFPPEELGLDLVLGLEINP